jgi:hypothetical protein
VCRMARETSLLQPAAVQMQSLQQLAATPGQLQCRAVTVVRAYFDKLIVAQRKNIRVEFFQMPPGIPDRHERREFVMAQHPTPPLVNA